MICSWTSGHGNGDTPPDTPLTPLTHPSHTPTTNQLCYSNTNRFSPIFKTRAFRAVTWQNSWQIIFLGDFGHRYVQQIHTLFGPAMKKKLRSDFPWLSMTIKIYLYWCDLAEAEK